MSLASNIVDTLLEADPEAFMQSHAKRWHAKYYRDKNGWYHVTWMRGLDMVEDEDLKLSKSQIEWLERYANWLDQPENMPYDAWRRYLDPMGQAVLQDYHSFSKWMERARARNYLKKYQHDVEPELPNIEEPLDEQPDLDETMSPEQFLQGFGDEWRVSFKPLTGEWLRMKLSKGFNVEGDFNVPIRQKEWWVRFVNWLEDKWPYDTYVQAIGSDRGPQTWIDIAIGRGMRDSYEETTRDVRP